MSTDPVFMKQAGQYYWYHNDHLGTPQVMTTSSGAVVWSAKYSSFGNAAVDSASTVVNPLRFPGQYEDAETGLYYNWFRYYQPDTGRYLEVDPIGFYGGQVNLYGYAYNNPLNYIDPYGLLPRWLWKKVEKKWPHIVDNSKAAIDNVTNKAFMPDDLEKMKELILDEIGFFEAKAFSEVNPYTNPVILTKKQKKILEKLIERLLLNKKLSPEEIKLVKKAKTEFVKALKSGRCAVK